MVLKKEKLILIGSYGRGNLGDDAFLVTMVNLFSDFDIVINSANDDLLPDSVINKITTIHTSNHSDILKKIKLFFSLKYIVYGGGDLWVELYDDKYPRQSLWKMIIVNLFCRILGKKVFYFGCGAEELKGFSLFLARSSAKLANYVIARENSTIDILKLKNIVEFPDLTINLFEHGKKRENEAEFFTIGISLLYCVPNPEKNFNKYINDFANFINSISSDDVKIVLFPMLISEEVEKDDLWVSNELIKLVNIKNVSIVKSKSVEKRIDEFSKLNLMIGTRLHANILSVLQGIPSLGISYKPKVKRFFYQNNLEQYCLDFEDLENLKNKYENIFKNYSEIKKDFVNSQKKLLEKKHLYHDFIKKNFK